MTDDEIILKIAELKGWREKGMPDKYSLSHIPNWPVNIQDAWELAEEMRFVGMRQYDRIWHCSVYDQEGSLEAYGTDESAPRAICLAYLAYMEAKG